MTRFDNDSDIELHDDDDEEDDVDVSSLDPGSRRGSRDSGKEVLADINDEGLDKVSRAWNLVFLLGVRGVRKGLGRVIRSWSRCAPHHHRSLATLSLWLSF